MEKIKLSNKQIFEIIPMGINSNNYEKTIEFSFISSLGYGEIESAFNNAENMGKIEYLSVSDELLKTYIDCVTLKSLAKEFGRQVEDNIIADIYTVQLIIK